MFGWPINSEEELNPGRFTKVRTEDTEEAGPSQRIRIVPNKTKSIGIEFGECYEARMIRQTMVRGMEQTGGAARETVCKTEERFE